MWILPKQTQPNDVAFDAALHSPAKSDPELEAFQACLRHEFAYSCAFCLVHKQDLVLHGFDFDIEGYPVWMVVPGSASPDERTYLWACFDCGSRYQQACAVPADAPLQPRQAAWCDAFEVHDGKLVPRHEHARQAERVLGLNRPELVRIRQLRAEKVAFLLHYRSELTSSIQKLWRALQGSRLSDYRRRAALWATVTEHNWLLRECETDLREKLKAAPAPRPRCSCELPPESDLPDWFGKQCFDLADRAG